MGTYEEALIFFGGLGIVIGAFNLIASAIKNLTEMRKPAKEKEENIESTLAIMKQRLDRDEQNIKDIAEGQRFICKGVKALLNHELHNGNSDEMQTSSEALDMWLINK